MKKFLLLSFFLLAGCWLNKTVDTAQNDVQKTNTTTETGNVLSQTWQNLSSAQTLSGEEKDNWNNKKTPEINIETKTFDEAWLNLNLPIEFGASYIKEKILDTSPALIVYASARWDIAGCKNIYPLIYTFKNNIWSWVLDNEIFIYPEYETVKNNNTTGDECVDIIKERYQRYDNFLKSEREITKTDLEFKFRFGWFTWQILKQIWRNSWIEFYNMWIYNTPCYDPNFEYKIYFLDNLNRLIEIRYYTYIGNYIDKFFDEYVSTHKNINKDDFKKNLCDDEWELSNNLNENYKTFVIENLPEYNPTDYENIQSIKKWVLDYINSK